MQVQLQLQYTGSKKRRFLSFIHAQANKQTDEEEEEEEESSSSSSTSSSLGSKPIGWFPPRENRYKSIAKVIHSNSNRGRLQRKAKTKSKKKLVLI